MSAVIIMFMSGLWTSPVPFVPSDAKTLTPTSTPATALPHQVSAQILANAQHHKPPEHSDQPLPQYAI